MDETQSQDTAFATENEKNDTFQFDVQEGSPLSSQDETAPVDTVSDPSSSSDDNDVVEDKKVPYSRFQSVVRERNEATERISSLEERLSELESARQETASTAIDDIDLPPEWVKLYGNSDVAKEAFKVQVQREQQISQNAVREALRQLEQRESYEREALVENEGIVEDQLSDLQEAIGRKLTKRQEEDILTIVDEFSPTGDDGKYISLFPFDKAYEIYELRRSKSGASTRTARQGVADLTGNQSEGEAETGDTTYKRGWDNWRSAL
jgi:hypothetical protein